MATINGTDASEVLMDCSGDFESALNVNGSDGDNTMAGDFGKDIYFVNSHGDQVIEVAERRLFLPV